MDWFGRNKAFQVRVCCSCSATNDIKLTVILFVNGNIIMLDLG